MAVSAIKPYEWSTWTLEVLPILLALPLLWFTRGRIRFTRLVYCLIALHCVVLMVGAHWSYEKVPLGDWVNHRLGWKRNDYDRIGHFFQGFVPALVAREFLIRKTELTSRKLIALLSICVAMAFSAIYELIEMFLALLSGGSAARHVDGQGDVWDPEWDMYFALVGSLCSQTLLWRAHDRQLDAARDEPLPAQR